MKQADGNARYDHYTLILCAMDT